jgi:hypothetical protein
MRKETSAGIIAGLISGLPVGAIFGGQVALMLWKWFETPMPIPSTNATMSPADYTFALTGVLWLFFTILSSFASLGAIIGFFFGVGLNKLPFRSTYVKAVIVSAILWVVFMLHSLPITYHWTRSGGASYQLSWSWESFPYLPLFTLDGLAFAYLFNRWAGKRSRKHGKSHIPTVFHRL